MLLAFSRTTCLNGTLVPHRDINVAMRGPGKADAACFHCKICVQNDLAKTGSDSREYCDYAIVGMKYLRLRMERNTPSKWRIRQYSVSQPSQVVRHIATGSLYNPIKTFSSPMASRQKPDSLMGHEKTTVAVASRCSKRDDGSMWCTRECTSSLAPIVYSVYLRNVISKEGSCYRTGCVTTSASCA